MRSAAYALLTLIVLFGAACAQAQVSSADEHFQRGRKLRQAGDLRGAKGEFERVILLAPDSANAYYMLAITLDNLGESQEAKHAFEQALKLNPNDAVTHHSYGNMLRKLGDYEGALSEHEQAIILNKDSANDASFLIALGDAQQLMGALEKARLSFERATRAQSDSLVRATAYFRLGYVLIEQGEAEQQAIRALRRGLELDPNDEYARKRLAELEAKGVVPSRKLPGVGAGTGVRPPS